MAQLTKNTPRNFELRADDYTARESIGLAAEHAYAGSAMGLNASTEFARQLNAGDAFLGFLERECDNSAGSAGDKKVTLRQKGIVRSLAVTGVLTSTDPGAKVYASDGATFTLTSTGNTYVGKIVRVISAGVADVAFAAAGLRLGDS